MLILGFHGKMQSGKDSAYKMIKEIYPQCVRVGFADKLKDSVCALFRIDRTLLDSLKLSNDYAVANIRVNESVQEIPMPMSWRVLLQRYGTESHRKIFGENFWVDQTLPYENTMLGKAEYKIAEMYKINLQNGMICVTDVRFPNEVARIKELGGVVVHLIRPSLEIESSHASEMVLTDGIDYTLESDNLDELRENVNNLLVELKMKGKL